MSQLFQSNRERTPVIADFSERGHEQLMRIRQTGQRGGECERSLQRFPADMGQREQMSRQVTAVHGRYIRRLQNVQVLGIVPVIEVSL